MPRYDSHVTGLLLAASGTVILSFSGVLARQVQEASDWQIILYRSIGLIFGLGILIVLRNRTDTLRAVSRSLSITLVAGPFQSASTILFILAVTHTTVANSMLLLAATPLIAATLGWMFLRERIEFRTALAMIAALSGIALMTGDGVRQGMGLGSVFAAANAVTMAIYIVLLRRASRPGNLDLLPTVMFGGLLAGAVSAAATPSFAVNQHDLILCLLWGAAVQTIGTALWTASARGLAAVELALFALLESVCGPLWAFLIVGEVPAVPTILGGGVVLLAMLAWTLTRKRGPQRAPSGFDRKS